MSAAISDSDVQVGIQPQIRLKDVLMSELRRRQEQCRQVRKCDRVWIAVAVLEEPELAAELSRAQNLGMDVQLIQNARALELQDVQTLSPLLWLKHSHYANQGQLPMHTKFAIFGDDTVVSSNANYSFRIYPHSREVFAVYRNAQVAQIFTEVFAMLRTRIFYPLKIQSDHNFVMLWNADRPRGYAASILKPYAQSTDENGQSADAYGHLFSWLERVPGRLQLAMSPLTNSCSWLGRWRCFFDLLKDRAARGELVVHYNSYFAVREFSKDFQSLGWRPGFAELLALPGLQPSLRVYQSAEVSGSLHHERLGRVGQDVVLLGSANYARPSTLNTIEWLRSPRVARQIDEYMASFDEPYFLFPNQNGSQDFTEAVLMTPLQFYKSCTMSRSRDLQRTPFGNGFEEGRAAPKKYRVEDLKKAVEARGWRWADLRWWAPEPLQDVNKWSEFRLRSIPEGPWVENHSSTFCFENLRLQRSEVFFIAASSD
jgi:hypothetical protein